MKVDHEEDSDDESEAESISIMPAHHAKRPLLVVANARHSTSYGCALRLDQATFDVLLGHARNTLSLSDLTFFMKKGGCAVVHHLGTLAAALRGQTAAEFVDEVDGAGHDSQQQFMARLTGNYKHGNERDASNHPRNCR
ncbi:MAG: hypothetical protein JF606_08890 [Burkholderiales bacterium]|nr:hypothetical protein [Burkholderiales bacterium]